MTSDPRGVTPGPATWCAGGRVVIVVAGDHPAPREPTATEFRRPWASTVPAAAAASDRARAPRRAAQHQARDQPPATQHDAASAAAATPSRRAGRAQADAAACRRRAPRPSPHAHRARAGRRAPRGPSGRSRLPRRTRAPDANTPLDAPEPILERMPVLAPAESRLRGIGTRRLTDAAMGVTRARSAPAAERSAGGGRAHP